MKVKFEISLPMNLSYGRATEEVREEMLKIERVISSKIESVIFDLPFLPTKEMSVDILEFGDFFGLSEEEYEYIVNYCDGIHDISSLMITPEYLEVALN